MVNADLSDLFKYSPEVAGYFTGQNQASNLQQNDEQTAELAQRIAASQAAEARANELQPYEVQNRDLTNQGLSAELPGKKAKSQLDQITATNAAATQQSDIEAKNAANSASVTKSKAEQYQTAQNVMLQAGPALSQVPAPLRKQAFQSILEANGIKPENSPHLQAILNSDPNQMPIAIAAIAKQLGEQALTMSPQAQAEMRSAATRAAAEVKAANIHAGGTVEAARITAGARVQAAEARLAQMKDMLAKDPKKAAVEAKMRAEVAKRQWATETDPVKKQQLAEEANFQDSMANYFGTFALQLPAAASANKPGLQTGPNGDVTIGTPKTVPPFGENVAPPPGRPAPATGQTSSGVKFKVVPNN